MIGVGSIENWAIIWNGGKPFITGTITGHPKFDDGSLIFTTVILWCEGRSMVTQTGSCYELVGPPEPGWVEWYGKSHEGFDFDNPVPSLYPKGCKTKESGIE